MTNRDYEMLLAGVCIGACAALLLDPRRGAARRSKVVDKFVRAGHSARDRANKRALDLRQRTRGRLYEARHKRERVDDEILVERVRAQMGKRVSNMHALEVSARDGVVTISGPVHTSERSGLIDILHKTRGVMDVRIREGEVLRYSPSLSPRSVEHPRA